MKEKALDDVRHSALRTAPDWIVRKIEESQRREATIRKRKANAKGCSATMQHKELELQLAEADL